MSCSSISTVSRPSSAANTAAAMPAGPAPTMARSTVIEIGPLAARDCFVAPLLAMTLFLLSLRAQRSNLGGIEVPGAALAADAHAGAGGDHAALSIRHAVDIGEAIEADAHHAIGRALAAVHRRLADARQSRD